MGITEQLRTHQEADPDFGLFFQAMHAFIDRTLEEFFWGAGLPHPVFSMEKDDSGRSGFYVAKDGFLLPHRISVNPWAVRNGEHTAEVVAHELVHLWEYWAGNPTDNNRHNETFHARMGEYGILTTGPDGKHTGYTNGRWQAWLEENEDLNLASFILPGTKENVQ